jgi:hypothetical protein
MHRSKVRFDSAMQRIRQLDALYVHLSNNLHFPTDTISDLLRAEIVYVISAFDKYIHDIVRQGMVEIFTGVRQQTSAYKSFQISIEQFDLINSSTSVPPPESVFESTVAAYHKHLSFQDPDKVAAALSLMWPEVHKWQRIAQCMGKTESDTRIELKNIIIRRNQIVHEGDIDLLTGQVQQIDHADTLESVNFINDLVTCIASFL